MITLLRTDSSHPDFRKLVNLLDAELAERDGDEHAFYNQFNQIDNLKYVVLAGKNGVFIGCGTIKVLDNEAMEVKRMFVAKEARGRGVARIILAELEKWASELGNLVCRLETGKRQPEAIAFYEKEGYQIIPNYLQYEAVENSICFEKKLKEPST
jgi:GNAT superfamily N-acetyltransferase